MSSQSTVDYSLILPIDRRTAFAILADPRLLDHLTPPWFRLQPLGNVSTPLAPGVTISYRFRWRGLPLPWTSLITEWRPPSFFAYRQLRGPYRSFRHEHFFEAGPRGTTVRDRVTFRTPGGRLVDRLVAQPELERIFAFRHRRLSALLADSQIAGNGLDGESLIPRTRASSSAIDRPT